MKAWPRFTTRRIERSDMAYKLKGTCVNVEYLVLGPIENNVYVIGNDTATFVVDPSCNPEVILDMLGDRKPACIVITHGHWDHTGAAAALREATGAPVIASAEDEGRITGERGEARHRKLNTPCTVDRTVGDGDVLEIGNMKWQVIATPGHTPGGLCFFLPSEDATQGAPVLISGDTLFAGTHGRTDFEESDPAAMSASLKRLADLPDETIVLPGHNNFTTIGRERWWLQQGGIVR